MRIAPEHFAPVRLFLQEGQGGRAMLAPTREAHLIPSPGGKVPSVSEADEECGRQPNERQTLPDFFPYPTFRRSSPAPVCALGHPPPGGGYRRSMTAPTRATHLRKYCRAGPWSRRKKAPLCKGGCQPNRLTGGEKPRYIFSPSGPSGHLPQNEGGKADGH